MGRLTVVTCVVSADVSDRIDLGHAIVARAAGENAQLVVFPSGFLQVERESQVEAAARELTMEARTHGISTVVGVDAPRPAANGKGGKGGKGAPSFDQLVKDEQLPFFVVVDDGRRMVVWRQRSTTSENAEHAKDFSARTFEVGGQRLHLFACGEIFNWRLKKNVGDRECAIVPTHTAHGQRFHHAIDWAKEKKVRLVRATHAEDATIGCDAEELAREGAARLFRAEL